MAMTGRFPFRPPSNCLERSLAAYRMLCAAAADPELVIGLRHADDRALHGHVWVTVGGQPVGERAADLAAYTPIVRFDANARRHASAASGKLLEGMSFR